MNDSEYAAKRSILRGQLSELERDAGIADAAGHLHRAMGSSARGLATRGELRALYFGVSHPALRKALVAKQRELELFERTRTRIQLEDARRHLDTIRRRPSEGWWAAAIVGASLVIVGYWLFTLVGAIAAGIAALFVGSGIEQASRRRLEQAIASAEEDVNIASAEAASAEQARDIFSEGEGATGQADRPEAAIHG